MEIIKKRNDSDEAVVGIVVTVLIIGLIISVYSIIQIGYMPQWQEQREADHMHDVAYQFSQLKYVTDVLSSIGQKNAISTYINLGIPDYPILGSGRTYDSLELLTDNCSITFSNNTGSYPFPIGTIKYSSKNSYFIDQSYIYEAGSLILSQSKSSILIGKPFLTVSNFTNVALTFVNIQGLDAKRYAGGYGTYSVYMEFLNSTDYLIENVTSIDISTNYENAWRIFFNSTALKYSGLTYTINDDSDGIRIDFNGNLGNFNIKLVNIITQIAPGWIE
jgi:hypothetical protein